MPALTYEGLSGLPLYGPEGGHQWRRIGTTVTVEWESADLMWPEPRYRVRLYRTTIAYVSATRVSFPVTGDQHQATREWLAQIVHDNRIGGSVYRHRGVLVIGGDKPLEGHSFPVGAEVRP
jgi:hypothetical protein